MIDANKFTPDTEFVADFSKANIFNQMASSANSCNGKLSNGLEGKVTTHQQSTVTNGNSNNNNNNNNGEMNENFADFEHNTIYNAAGMSRTILN